MTTPGVTKTDEGGSLTVTDYRLCAISQFECAADEYQCAWDWMYEIWLPESGFLPSDVPAFERYDFNSYDKDTGKAIVDVCIPLMGK